MRVRRNAPCPCGSGKKYKNCCFPLSLDVSSQNYFDQEETQMRRETIMEVVDNQLRANDPPETNQTLLRLISEGYSETQAKELIATVILFDLSTMLRERREFDHDTFVQLLDQLPNMPE
jgi:hypothetical protein